VDWTYERRTLETVLVICEADVTAAVVYIHQCKYMIVSLFYTCFFSECQSFIIEPLMYSATHAIM